MAAYKAHLGDSEPIRIFTLSLHWRKYRRTRDTLYGILILFLMKRSISRDILGTGRTHEVTDEPNEGKGGLEHQRNLDNRNLSSLSHLRIYIISRNTQQGIK